MRGFKKKRANDNVRRAVLRRRRRRIVERRQKWFRLTQKYGFPRLPFAHHASPRSS